MAEKVPEGTKTADLFKPEFIEEIKKKLQESRKELHGKLGLQTFPDYGDEEDDNVHEIEGFLVNESLKAEYEKELRDVEAALKRIKAGTYGICKYTGVKIDEKRLQARPTSSSSVEAKESFQPRKKD